MSANVKIELLPFGTPNFVILVMPPDSPAVPRGDSPKLALKDVDAQALADLCDQFRAEIFQKAGKPDPQEART